MKLSGIEVKNYKSIGETGIRLSPLRKCNIIIGKNNSGKSNVAGFFQHIHKIFIDRKKTDNKSEMAHVDRHHQNRDARLIFNLEFASEESDIAELALQTDEIFKFTFTEETNNNVFSLTSLSFDNDEDYHFVNRLIKKFGYPSMRNSNSENVRATIEGIKSNIFANTFASKIPNIQFIPEFRQMTYSEADKLSYKENGTNMIKRLAYSKNPNPGASRDNFLKIEQIVKNLLEMPDIHLSVSEQEPRVITLQKGSHTAGLDSYGTGTHELILMVAVIILGPSNVIWCIEEPEIHMHPSLQRKFIEFLITQTDNDYIITTHSPTLINIASELPEEHHGSIQIFHVEKVNDETIGRAVLNDTDSLTAIADLGFRASDILQTNCVIWVEGPSDRIYLKHWLSLIDPDLREGFHFSIMLYGGRLGTHLSADRGYPDEFIDILHINQNTIFIMDSDKDTSDTPLLGYKKRITQECEDNTDNIAWITDGREIENYIPASVIGRFLSEHRNSSDIIVEFDYYERLESIIKFALEQNDVQSFDYSNDKVGYSKKIIKHITKDDIPEDLQGWLDKIIEKIYKWNHLNKSN